MKNLYRIIATITLLIALSIGATSTCFAAFAAGIPYQAKADILAGVHLDADTYKCALYTQSTAVNVNLSATAYGATGGSGSTSTITGELTSSGTGYSTGGVTVTKTSSVSSTKGISDFSDAVYTSLTTGANTVDAFVIYNTTRSNKIIFIGALSTPLAATAATGTIVMPTADSTNALIRLSKTFNLPILTAFENYYFIRRRA